MKLAETEIESTGQELLAPTIPETYWLGFVRVEQFEGIGHCGGYLILNQLGHPCEFHCSLPIQPTKTQTVLYGPRLNEYIIGNLIIPTLISKSKIKPSAILADNPDTFSLETSLSLPVAYAFELDTDSNSTSTASDEQPSKADETTVAEWFRHRIENIWEIGAANESTLSIVNHFATRFSITEPFQRIFEALSEAQNSAAA